MRTNCCNPAKLVLDDGTVLLGKSIGSRVNKIGELVFNTAMTGYVETLTDPSFFGQIVVQTFPEIGNYGVCFDDCEAKNPGAFGFIVKKLSTHPFNFRKQQKLGAFQQTKLDLFVHYISFYCDLLIFVGYTLPLVGSRFPDQELNPSPWL